MKRCFLFVTLVIIFYSVSLKSSESRTLVSDNNWISEKQREYNERIYLTDMGSGVTIEEARVLAVQNLTERLIATLQGTRITRRNIEETSEIRNTGRQDLIIKGTTFSGGVDISTNVKLIGVEIIISPLQSDGRYYAFAYMNRQESAARYRQLIAENERAVTSLIEDAGGRFAGQLISVQRWQEAALLAFETDTAYTVYSVLSSNQPLNRPIYGNLRNATEVKLAADEAKNLFSIKVEVTGDVNGRITNAISTSINSLGYRTGSQNLNTYVLSASFILTNEEINNPDYKFASYTLQYSLVSSSGSTLFTGYSEGIEGHQVISQARDWAIRSAIQNIETTGFKSEFEKFLKQ
ncbi:MAG: hypothetical protein FWG98_12100 [Candidatus Cloacimonetes bacterium]|nr:hypothetical protein [Candidatus Cloacimonadota bacterium]